MFIFFCVATRRNAVASWLLLPYSCYMSNYNVTASRFSLPAFACGDPMKGNKMREYKFEIGETVYAIGGDFDAVFVGKVIKRGFIDGNVNVYAVSSPKYNDELFLENGLISADTAYAMIAG